MNMLRFWPVVAAALVTSGCQMQFNVNVVVRDGVPLVTFSQPMGLFREASPARMCVWKLEIVDVERRVSVVSARATSPTKCVSTDRVDFARLPVGFSLVGKLALVGGQSYRAEVIADEGVHESEPWTQPVGPRPSS